MLKLIRFFFVTCPTVPTFCEFSGENIPKDWDKGYEVLTYACQDGTKEAFAIMGKLADSGTQHVPGGTIPKDEKTAFKWVGLPAYFTLLLFMLPQLICNYSILLVFLCYLFVACFCHQNFDWSCFRYWNVGCYEKECPESCLLAATKMVKGENVAKVGSFLTW